MESSSHKIIGTYCMKCGQSHCICTKTDNLFTKFKKQFDKSFAKVKPDEFVNEMEKQGYKFEPMEPNNKIDLEGIYKEKTMFLSDYISHNLKDKSIDAMKEAIRQVLPLILEHVAAKAETEANTYSVSGKVDKESITSQKDEILKLLGINN